MKNKNDMPSFITGLPEKAPDNAYLKDFKKTILARNARNFAFLFAGCFAIMLLAVVVIPAIPSTGEDPVVVQSQGVVKFAKVEADENVGGDVGLLAGAAQAKPAQKSKYKTIRLEEKAADSFKPFKAKTNCVANIRNKPDKDSTIIVQKEYGEEVKIIGEEDDWWKISYHGDGAAYVHKTCINRQ